LNLDAVLDTMFHNARKTKQTSRGRGRPRSNAKNRVNPSYRTVPAFKVSNA
jgi:hypothetical protein